MPRPALPLYILSGERAPPALSNAHFLAASVPGLESVHVAGSLHELLASVSQLTEALVLLCVSNRRELAQAGRVLEALASEIKSGRVRVLCFNAIDLVKVGASLAHLGAADVLPYSLSRTGLTTKLHYNAKLIGEQNAAPQAEVGADRSPGRTGEPEDFPLGAEAFAGFTLEVKIFPDGADRRTGVSAEILERGQASLILDVSDDGLIRTGAELRSELVCEGVFASRAELRLRIDSVEACGDSRALVFASILSGDVQATDALFRDLADRQTQIANFISETRGW